MIKVSLSHNWGLKIVSLIVGVSVFLYVNSLELAKGTNTRQVPLAITGLGTDLQVISIPDTVNVTIKAPFDVLDRLNLNNIKLRAYVDLQGAEPGDGVYNVGLNRPAEIKDLEWDWDKTVPIKLEAILEEPHPVSIEWPDGFDASNTTVSAQTVNLRGPESELQKVSTIQARMKLSDALAGGTYNLPVEVLDRNGKLLPRIEIRPSNISVSVLAGQSLPKRDILISPRYAGQPKVGYYVQSIKVDPPSVIVQGERKEMIDLSTIETEPIRLDGLKQSTDIRVKLVIPRGIELVEDTEVTVHIKIARS